LVFLRPILAFAEAREHLPAILAKRGIPVEAGLATLEAVGQVVQVADASIYSQFEEMARMRLVGRDPEDWPVLAAALALGCPIWTEDKDFFGTGVAIWTSDRVELFLSNAI
jgi:predicted nucleic acid-binding protein